MLKKFVKKFFVKDSFAYKIVANIYFLSLIVRDFLKRIIYAPFLLLKIDENKVVISNYSGRGYGDNGKSLAKLLKKDFKIVWPVVDIDDSSIPADFCKVKFGSKAYYRELSTAVGWIDNVRKSEHPFKRKNQFYIQTWHGSISLKKIEKDAEKKLNIYYLHKAKKDSRMADLMVSNGHFSSEMYRRAFWYDKEIIEAGSPRCDVLFNQDQKKVIKDRVYKFFDLKAKDKILLYAPTFRNNLDLSVYDIDFNQLLKLEKFKDYKVLLRHHPNIADKFSGQKDDDNIYNASAYADMYELLSVADILITDYSSTMFEFAYQKKPVFLYTKDLLAYKQERDVYFDLKDLPFPYAKDNKELVQIIKNFDLVKYQAELNTFYKDLGVIEDGKASLRVYQYILDNFLNT